MSSSYDLFWQGNKLKSSPETPLSFDTETEVIEDKSRFPRMVLATACDGETNCVIGPHQLVAFFLLHHDSYFVGHNVAFDFWVVLDWLDKQGATKCQEILWNAAEKNRVCDTMLLDQLLWLAKGKGESNKTEGVKFFRRSLASVAKEYLGLTISKKENEYRMRFAELWETPLEKWQTDVDPGFFEYATTDTLVTWEAYKVMREQGVALQKPFLNPSSSLAASHGMYPDAIERYGVLTEAIQVKGSIALAKISKNGLRVDKEKAAQLESSIRKEFDEFIPFLEENFPHLLQPYVKKEGYKVAKKSGVPCLKNKEIQKLFEEWSPELGLEAPIKSKGKLGGTSISVKDWAQFKDKKEFIKRWVNARTLSKRLGFFDLFKGGDFLHPDYNVLVRTGRTSCIAKGTLIEVVRDVSMYPKGKLIEDVKPGELAYGFTNEGRLTLRKVLWSGKTGHRKIVRIHWKGTGKNRSGFLDLTEEHPVRLIDGSYVPAGYLQVGARISSLSRGVSQGYAKLYPSGAREISREHRFIMEEVEGVCGEHVHHKNGNKLDNRIENLENMDALTHLKYHGVECSPGLRKFRSEEMKSISVRKVKIESSAAYARACKNNHEVIRVERLPDSVDVYDLEVEDIHNFIANELCVHNCEKPNTQQMPRQEEFRNCFVPRPGFKLVTADYAAIELRTLGTICQKRFGYSVLLDTIKAGIDPHAYTAAMFAGMTLEEFMKLKETDPKQFKNDRQAAKACFHRDVELLTPSGWKRVEEITTEDKVAQYISETGEVFFVYPHEKLVVEDQKLLKLKSRHYSLRVTPDHRMYCLDWAENPKVCLPHEMPSKARKTVHSGRLNTDSAEDDLNIRRAVCIQADGSLQGSSYTFGFKKTRKIERFRELFGGEIIYESYNIKNQITRFSIKTSGPWSVYLTDKKTFNLAKVLGASYSTRKSFLDELYYWDGSHKSPGGAFTVTTVCSEVAEAIQAVAAVTDARTVMNTWIPNLSSRPAYSVSIFSSTTARPSNLINEGYSEGETVYCVSVPSTFLLTRDDGCVQVVGNCGFGVPGGLGKVKLSEYAKANYGVTMSHTEAETFRTKLITDVYPELKKYLGSTEIGDLAMNLDLSDPGKLYDFIFDGYGDPGMICYCLQQVLDGKPFKKDGTPYQPFFVTQMWKLAGELLSLSPRPEKVPFLKDVEKRVPNWKLVKFLFGGTATTLTGRIRKGVKFTEVKNSPFQGLAADGGKLALFNLVKKGMHAVGFIHDEVLVEVPQEEDAALVEEIMVSSMEDVLDKAVSVSVEYGVGDSWKK